MSRPARPVAPDALFRIASVSKPVTAAAVLRLLDRGRLKLDDRVFDVLRPARAGAAGRRVRPAVEASHRRPAAAPHRRLGPRRPFDPMFRSPRHRAGTEGAAAGRPGRDHPLHARAGRSTSTRGTRYAYSNFGYCLLGRVIEKACGQPLRGVRRERSAGAAGHRDDAAGPDARSETGRPAKSLLRGRREGDGRDGAGPGRAGAAALRRLVPGVDGRPRRLARVGPGPGPLRRRVRPTRRRARS